LDALRLSWYYIGRLRTGFCLPKVVTGFSLVAASMKFADNLYRCEFIITDFKHRNIAIGSGSRSFANICQHHAGLSGVGATELTLVKAVPNYRPLRFQAIRTRLQILIL
jgi:hypothetical protein